jgi:hypothetical protein
VLFNGIKVQEGVEVQQTNEELWEMGVHWTKIIRQTDKEEKMILNWPHTPQTIRNN